MPAYPYILELNSVVGSNSSATLTYPMPNNETLQLMDIGFVATGAFSITDIRDSTGKHYTNASPSNPILSTQIQDTRNAFLSLKQFVIPIVLDGGKTFYVDVLDTSGAQNTIRLIFNGTRETNGS